MIKTYSVFLSDKDVDILGKAINFIAYKIAKIEDQTKYKLLEELVQQLCENYLNIGIHLGKSNPDRYSITVLDGPQYGDLICKKTGKPVVKLYSRMKALHSVFFCETCEEFHEAPQIRRKEDG